MKTNNNRAIMNLKALL